MSSYLDLDIYKITFELSLKVHRYSLNLPKFELYEQGSQVRRSSKSIKDQIAEGYGRRRYKSDFIKFLVYAQASNDERLNQINTLIELYPEMKEWQVFKKEYNTLGMRINKFIQYVENNWKS